MLLDGRWLESPGLHVEVSLGKTLNPELFLMSWSAPCVNVCMNYTNALNVNEMNEMLSVGMVHRQYIIEEIGHMYKY